MSEVYPHINNWNEDFKFKFRQCETDMFDEDGRFGRGMHFEMQEWAPEAAKRLVSCPGFVVMRFEDAYDTDGDCNDAQLLYRRCVRRVIPRECIVIILCCNT